MCANPLTWDEASKYAEAYVEWLNNRSIDLLSDISDMDERMELDALWQEEFVEMEMRLSRCKSRDLTDEEIDEEIFCEELRNEVMGANKASQVLEGINNRLSR